MLALRLLGVSKRFQEVAAVDRLSLEVEAGEFVSLLGPSGCGKTTTLRMIAGLAHPDEGQIMLGNREITSLPPDRRGIGMVFQDYALFPHMTIEENIAFGLQMRKVGRSETKERVQKALDLVRLSGLQKRYPRQLSGGQQQRVALARALVIEPQLLLLDEPLSNLDAKLRQEMRVELKLIQRRVGITTLFVTHDQEEALTLSDQIVVMNHGCIVQIGTPIEIYEKPKDSFVASFLGQENFFRGKVVSQNGNALKMETAEGLLVNASPNPGLTQHTQVMLVIKKERIKIKAVPAGRDGVQDIGTFNAFPAKVDFVTYLGTAINYLCSLRGQRLLVSVPNEAGHPAFQINDQVILTWEPRDCVSIALSQENQ